MSEKLAQWQESLLRDYPGLFDVAGYGVDESSLISLLTSQGKGAGEAEEIAKLAVQKAQAEEFKMRHPLFGGWRRRK